MPHGTFIFPHSPAYEWYLSITAIGLIVSWNLHNLIAWMKNKPFLSRKVSLCYISTVILVQPYWIVEIYANFAFFRNQNTIYKTTRPMEPLFRDPWWIFTTVSIFYIIKREYSFKLIELVRVSPRFGIMLASMCLSIIFMIIDTCSVLGAFDTAHLATGIQPFWKLSFIFKCLCDTVILDDFKTALDHIRSYHFSRSILGHEESFWRHSDQQQADVENGISLSHRGSRSAKRNDQLPRVAMREDIGV
jgi:hypothetical protein